MRSIDGCCERSAWTAVASSAVGAGEASGDAADRVVAGGSGGPAEDPLRIAMLAPPWISVPAPGYGGVESVVSTLTEALVRRGHDVTLFCAPGSVSQRDVVTLLDESHPDEIERSLYEVDHVARAFDLIDLAAGGDRFDVVHDHCGFTALAMADRIDTPLVHTLHGPFTPTPRRSTPTTDTRRRSSGSAGHSSRRHRPSWGRSARSRIRSTCAPGRCRSTRTTTCCGSAG